MALRSCSHSPLRESAACGYTAVQTDEVGKRAQRIFYASDDRTHNLFGNSRVHRQRARPAAFIDEMMVDWEVPPKKHSPPRTIRPNSPTPSGWEHASRLRRQRQGAAQPASTNAVRSNSAIASTPTCTSSPTPIATPLQIPTTTPATTTYKKVKDLATSQLMRPPATNISTSPRPATAIETGASPSSLPAQDPMPPAAGFLSRRLPFATTSAAFGADPAALGSSGGVKKAETSGVWLLGYRANPLLARQGLRSAIEGKEAERVGERGRGCRVGSAEVCTRKQETGDPPRRMRGPAPGRRGRGCGDATVMTKQVMPSIEKEVDDMLDNSKGTLGLSQNNLGDERVPALSLQRLRDSYRSGTSSLRSWTTRGLVCSVESDDGAPALAQQLVEVEHGRLGVLYSTDAYLFHFRIQPTRSEGVRVGEERETWKEGEEFHLAYIWLGREADAGARASVRAQGRRLLERLPRSTPPAPTAPLEVEQGSEPALFLGLFSYMMPPLAAVVHQARQETPDLRVFELQESPCLQGAGIALAVEGDASLLAKHGPLPSRSYVILVNPHRRRVGKHSAEGGGQDLVGAFDEGFYWHGVGETAAVEALGNLLCQQVERMFPPPSAAQSRRRRKKRRGGRQRAGSGAVVDSKMMRGCISDVKLGCPIPEGFWPCIHPEGSLSHKPGSVTEDHHRKLLSQNLRPSCRSRPVRIFGVCFESMKAGQSFVWEVTTGGLPSQMKLSPSLSHVVDAGGSKVYVWHGAGSHSEARRLALRVAWRYAERVEGGATVEQADAGSEPIGLLECFLGWDKALVEPPPMRSFSPGRTYPRGYTSAEGSPPLTPTASASRDSSPTADAARLGPRGYRHRRARRRRSGSGRASSSGSTSTASRLTPPGQRTPPFNSPPSLNHFLVGGGGGGGYSPTRLRYQYASRAPLAMPSRPEGMLLTPPRRLRQQAPLQHETEPRRTGANVIDVGVDFELRQHPTCREGTAPETVEVLTDRTNSTSPLKADSRGSEVMTFEGFEAEAEGSENVEHGVRPVRHGDMGGGGALVGRVVEGVLPLTSEDVLKCIDQVDHYAAGRSCVKNIGRLKRVNAKGWDGGARGLDSSLGMDGVGGERDRDENRDRYGRENCDATGGGAQRAHVGDGVVEKDKDRGHKNEKNKRVDEAVKSGVPLRHTSTEFSREFDALKSASEAVAAASEAAAAASETAAIALELSASRAFNDAGSRGSSTKRREDSSKNSSDFPRSPLSGNGAASLVRLSSMISMSDGRTEPLSFDSDVNSPASENRPARDNDEAVGHHDRRAPAVRVNEAIDSQSLRCPGPSGEEPVATPDPANFTLSEKPTLGPKRNRRAMRDSRSPTAIGSRPPGETADAGVRPPASPKSRMRETKGSRVRGDRGDRDDPKGVASNADCGGSQREDRGGDSRGANEVRGAVTRPWVGLNEDGSWRSELERWAAGAAGAAEAERRRLSKISGDNSWRADGGEGEAERGQLRAGVGHARREITSLTSLQKGNVRDKLNMFEGVSSSPPVKFKEKECGERSSIGQLHGRGLVSSLNKKLTDRRSPDLPPLVIDPTPSENHASRHGGACHQFPPYSTGAIRKGGRSPIACQESSQRTRELVWWKQRAGPSPLKSRPSLELIRDGQVRIMSKQLLMASPGVCADAAASTPAASGSVGEPKSKTETASITTNTQAQPPMSSSTPPPRPGRLRWGAGSGNTSPTKRSNFWLAKTMLGANKGNKYRDEGECPASAPVTPTNNRKGAWWRKSRTVLTPLPSSMWGKAGTTTTSVATDGYGHGNANGRAEEGQAQDGGGCTINKRPASTWVKLRRRVGKEAHN